MQYTLIIYLPRILVHARVQFPLYRRQIHRLLYDVEIILNRLKLVTQRLYTGCIKKKLNKSELAFRLCKAPQCTKFFIDIGCLGTNNVNRKIEKFKILKPGVVSFITS